MARSIYTESDIEGTHPLGKSPRPLFSGCVVCESPRTWRRKTEIFFDFGLFEFLAIIGIAALSRRVYSSKFAGILFMIASVAGPAALLFLSPGPVQKWIAVLCLATATVNVAVVGAVVQRGSVPALKFPAAMRKQFGLRGSMKRPAGPHGSTTLGPNADAILKEHSANSVSSIDAGV